MKKIIQYLKDSNHLTHAVIGFIIGLISFNLWTAILATTCLASAAETKDKQYTKNWDWQDFLITLVSGLVGFIVYRLISIILL